MPFNSYCNVRNCHENFYNSRCLIKHLKDHIVEGFTVQCPISGCNKTYNVISSFTSHLSRYHREQNAYTLAVDSEADHIFVDENMNNIEDEMLDTSQSIVANTNPETPLIGYAMLLLSM